MAKSPDAFRTISEVSAWLETPPHVLRFWESKFPQVKPVKRAGGRRYYRPEDIALLGGIKVLLHEQGMTIRGVQKMLREQGVRHVASLSAQVWAEDGAGEAGLEEISDADLDVALGDEVDGDDAEEPDEVANGVIVGPWAGRDGDREVDAAEEDEPYLAALDGLRAEGALADEAAEDARGRDGAEGGLAARGPEAGSDARVPTLIEGFLAGTASRFAAGADRGSAPPARAALPPLPPGEPTLERALALLRRADPDRLHARADRIAPLLQRLKRLREGLPHRSA